ncbi:MAG: hypothetical protein ACI9XU_000996 [Arenicella sp.]|jgi:hypothetical protein
MFVTRSITIAALVFIGMICLHKTSLNAFALTTDPVANLCAFSGSYQQSKELDGLSRPLLSNGVLYYDCRHGVIWKTIEPIEQALVLLNEGTNYLVDGEKVKRLTGRKGKMLGDIINAFISNDLSRLSQHFDVTNNVADNDSGVGLQVVLLPKRKQLKRAFERVTITTKDAQNQLIEMVDKKGLTTTIRAIKNVSQDSDAKCELTTYFSAQECELLLKPDSV